MQQIVTQQLVDDAANAVIAAGGKPTFRLIQQRVGGSFTTLKPMLTDWDMRRKNGEIKPIDVPEALLAKGIDLIKIIFAEVTQQADIEIDVVRKNAITEITATKDELREAMEEITHLEMKNIANGDEIVILKNANHDLELKIGKLEERVQRSNETEINLSESRSALAKMEQQLVDLQAQLIKAGDVQQQIAGLEQRLRDQPVIGKKN